MNTVFSVDDRVIHCRDGLAQIISTIKMGEKDYFLVKSLNGGEESIYVPIDRASSIIRHLMDLKEAEELLKLMKSFEKNFNTNTKQRRDAYKRSLASGDVKEIAYLARQLYFYHQLGPNNGEIKLGPVDMDMLNYANNMLMDELAIVYKIDRANASEIINEKVNKM